MITLGLFRTFFVMRRRIESCANLLDSLQFSRERIGHEISLVQMTMENWDATNNDEEIENLSQIIQLISTRIKDLSF
jgi:hypothetical protein